MWDFAATFAFCIKANGLATFFIVPTNCIFWGAFFESIKKVARLFAQKLQGFNGNPLFHCYTLALGTCIHSKVVEIPALATESHICIPQIQISRFHEELPFNFCRSGPWSSQQGYTGAGSRCCLVSCKTHVSWLMAHWHLAPRLTPDPVPRLSASTEPATKETWPIPSEMVKNSLHKRTSEIGRTRFDSITWDANTVPCMHRDA